MKLRSLLVLLLITSLNANSLDNLGSKSFKERKTAITKLRKDATNISKAKKLMDTCISKYHKTNDMEIKLSLLDIIYHCCYTINYKEVKAIIDKKSYEDEDQELLKLMVKKYNKVRVKNNLSLSIFTPGFLGVINTNPEYQGDEFYCDECQHYKTDGICPVCGR
jgi:hypothetical protein